MNEIKTKVVFRVWPDGAVIAMFPDIREGRGLCSSYMHVGQHGIASLRIVDETKPATSEQYASLMQELTQIGYNLVVRRRITRQRDA